MNNKIEVSMRCQSTKSPYTVVFEEEQPQKWYANEAKIPPQKSAKKTSLWQKIISVFEVPATDNTQRKEFEQVKGIFYMGKMKCPYCGNRNFIKCRRCGQMTCSPEGATSFKCASCNNEGKIKGTISDVSASKSESPNDKKPTSSNQGNNVNQPKNPWQQG